MSAPTSTILWCRSGSEFSRVAADHVAALLARKPEAVIALPTGQTPLGLYAELVARTAAKRLSVAQARFFNLDDYLGVSADHPLSYARFLREHFLMPAGVAEEHIRLLQGDAVGIEAECRDYEAAIAAAGGLDLAILGLGTNGHIGFNEPGSDWSAQTHVVSLSPETRATHVAQTQGKFVIPECGITVGICDHCRGTRNLAAGGRRRQGARAGRLPTWHPGSEVAGHGAADASPSHGCRRSGIAVGSRVGCGL